MRKLWFKRWTKLSPFKRKLYLSLLLTSFFSGLFIPIAYAGDPWYIKPVTWILDAFVEVLGGIHDPMDHVFYNGCGDKQFFQPCVDRSVWGFYTSDQFYYVAYRGFMMFMVVTPFFVISSIVKSGMLLPANRLSSTFKFDLMDMMIKSIIAIVLLSQFFPLISSMFKVNNMVVNLVREDLKGNTVVVRDGRIATPLYLDSGTSALLNSDTVGRTSSTFVEGERIQMENINANTSGAAKAMSSIAVRGVSIWWEAYYLQRKFLITILIVLAPLWISSLFYPALHGITLTAMKELWAQIISQAIHAVLFWVYYNIFDNQFGWMQTVIALAMFIPISESVRYIFGATSNTGGKIATIGAMTGVAGMLNIVGAVKSIGGGAKDSALAKAGQSAAGAGSSGGGSGRSTSSNSGGGGSGSEGAGRPSNNRERNAKAAAALGRGFGSAGMRMVGFAAGSGLGPAGGYLGGEAGARIGEGIGHRAGVASYTIGSLVQKGGQEATNFARNYQASLSVAQGNMIQKEMSAIGAAARNLGQAEYVGMSEAEKASAKRENAAHRAGVAGELVFGGGGYETGDAYARRRNPGRLTTSSDLKRLKDNGIDHIFTVENSDSSYLATYDAQSKQYNRISNLGAGNTQLSRGQTAVTQYQIQADGASARLVPTKQQVNMNIVGGGSGDNSVEQFVNVSYLISDSGKHAYSGPTIDPHKFLNQPNVLNQVDFRRRNFTEGRG